MNVSAETPAAAPAMLDVRQVAMMLGCSPRHCYRLADSGAMPRPKKLGNLCRWSRQELESWIADGCKPVASARQGGAK